MFACASLVALALALASPVRADPDYPAGLFERSPLNGPPAAVSRRAHNNNSPSQSNDSPLSAPAIERASGACHHYREWRYPWPQPC
jgi:hypothetical protein